MIGSFTKLAKEQEPFADGKGRTLARLYQAGYRVPDGFIILPAAFVGDQLTTEAWVQVQAHLARMRRDARDGSFAVRSSALSEDSAQASFAGEFETVVDVRTDKEIRQAIHVVRCSRNAVRGQAYSQAQGLGETEHEIAIVVQRLIRADFSGVLFTADPVTGDLMRMTGNFVPGLGEKLVSGQANPQTFTLARPKGAYSGPADLNRLARALYRNACGLEKELGGPQDIEWAIAEGRLYILQSRPITTLVGYKADTSEWNDSLTGNFLWSGTNLAENAPYVLTPFTCSLRKGLVHEGVDFCDSSSVGVDGYPLLVQPRDLANWLDALQLEVSRRFKFLAEAGAENWTLAPAPKAPRLLIVVDDFSILGDMLDAPERRALWLAARRLAADSRKSGIHLALAVQNPTWQSLDLGIRRNCTPLTFRVNDGDASRVILNMPGAEALGKRQFLTVLGGLERGVAFAPTDEQIADYLEHHQVPALPRPEWLPAAGSPSAVPEASAPDQAAQIRALHAAGKSLNAIQTQVFGYRGGAAYAAVRAALGDTTAVHSDT